MCRNHWLSTNYFLKQTNNLDLFHIYDFQGKKKKVKYVYKTAQEAIETGSSRKKGIKSQMSNVKVIDMTGKEKKVLTGKYRLAIEDIIVNFSSIVLVVLNSKFLQFNRSLDLLNLYDLFECL